MASVITIAVANQKGGVGKTTSVVSIAAALAEQNYRVLAIDMDPQGSLTFSLGIDPEDVQASIGDILIGGKSIQQTIIEAADDVFLVPANMAAASAEQELYRRGVGTAGIVSALASLELIFDWVLLDCPPTLGLLTTVALAAADGVLIPLQCETLAHRGVGLLLDTVYDVRAEINPRLGVIGVLPTLFDGRTRHSRDVLEAITGNYHLAVVQPAIPRSVRFAEAPAIGRSLLHWSTDHKGSEAYRGVAAHLCAWADIG